MVEKAEVLEAHRKRKGKFEIVSKVPLSTKQDLSTFYTPGVAFVSEAIHEDQSRVYDYTTKSNTVAIVSDGTRLLGLGKMGPHAAMPVMEGKAVLFKKFGGVDAIPLCIATTDESEIIRLVTQIAPTFGAINIEDLESPKSFRVVSALSRTLDIPVFHDDQQGTAVVALAALLNALKLAGKKKDAKIVVNGAGSAGVGVVRLLSHAGFRNLFVLDSAGLIYKGRTENMNEFKEEMADITNPEKKRGGIEDAVAGADVLIGVSTRDAFSKELVAMMNRKAIVFALANPYPEISYEDAKAAGAYVVATGRSDTPNQVNNVLAFPAIMRGLLDIRAKALNYEILLSAATAISKCVGKDLGPEKVVPSPTDRKTVLKIAANVAVAVASTAMKTGVAGVSMDPAQIKAETKERIKRYWKLESKLLK